MSEALKFRKASEVPELKDFDLKSLFEELHDIEEEIAGLEETKSRVRGIIAEKVKPLGFPVRDGGYQATWSPGKKTGGKLDEQLLVKAGVTPDQLAMGRTNVGTGEPFLIVRSIKDEEVGPDA